MAFPTHFQGQLFAQGVPLTGGSIPATFGTTFFVDAYNGNDANDGLSMDFAKSTVLAAYNLTTSGNHDVIVLTGNAAHSIADEITVSKNRVHFVGLGGGSRYMGQRTRFEMGTTTGTAIAIIQVTGVGCTFTNIKFRSTDDLSTSLYAVADGGEFTQWTNCSFEKDEDLNQTTAAELLCNADTGYYLNCSIGNCIYTKSVARANVLFTRTTIAGKVARDCIFEDCILMNRTSATTAIFGKATANDIERVCLFKNCTFWNAKTSSATQAACFIVAAALTDGEILLQDCVSQNVTDIAAGSKGIFTTRPAPSATGTESVEVTTT